MVTGLGDRWRSVSVTTPAALWIRNAKLTVKNDEFRPVKG